jgi:hypothetical protein
MNDVIVGSVCSLDGGSYRILMGNFFESIHLEDLRNVNIKVDYKVISASCPETWFDIHNVESSSLVTRE